MNKTSNQDDPGPRIYEVMRTFQNASSSRGKFEAELFTDARIMGEISLGPLHLINPVAVLQEPGFFRPAIVLRCQSFDFIGNVSLERTDTSRYHAGSFLDEVCALVSLALGMRLLSGTVTRTFETMEPEGRPTATGLKPWPDRKSIPNRAILPWNLGPFTLDAAFLGRITELSMLSPGAAAILVKAARLYQQAIWIGEWEPERAWLLLVSAIEALANVSGPIGDVELLRDYAPDIAVAVEEAGGDSLLNLLAPKLRHLVASKRKFVEFLITFLPAPPVLRPSAGRIDWEPGALRIIFGKIYAHRSKALHDGTPFPHPMCSAPLLINPDEPPVERPFSLAQGSFQGTWLLADTPMMLHIFEYIVRNAILKWWDARIAECNTAPQTT
jgi:hypothetical protein